MCRPEKRAHTRVRPYKYFGYYSWGMTRDSSVAALPQNDKKSRSMWYSNSF